MNVFSLLVPVSTFNNNSSNANVLFFLSVVVIGFERSFYIVYEGLETEVCVAVLDRELTNDEERVFTVATGQIADSSYTASRNMLQCYILFCISLPAPLPCLLQWSQHLLAERGLNHHSAPVVVYFVPNKSCKQHKYILHAQVQMTIQPFKKPRGQYPGTQCLDIASQLRQRMTRRKKNQRDYKLWVLQSATSLSLFQTLL